ncbi:MAG: MarR family winged helix-turn-helix transcriptional regulator [Rhodospirillaceae bacterium]|nr:MarR family winged helix-turn-helix transcriptional regulator [Rhodospirillaceae bacterium]
MPRRYTIAPAIEYREGSNGRHGDRRLADAELCGRVSAGDYRLDEQIGFLLRRAQQRATAIFTARFAGYGLTPTQFAALAKIADEGEVSQNRLGRLTAMDPATMKGVTDRLSERGLIAARADQEDRRRTQWRLTDPGAALLAAAYGDGFAVTAEILDPLSPRERATFLRLLEKIT